MSEKLKKTLEMLEAAVEQLSQEKQEAAIANALFYAQGFAAGIMAQKGGVERELAISQKKDCEFCRFFLDRIFLFLLEK